MLFFPAAGLTNHRNMFPSRVTVKNVIVNMMIIGLRLGFMDAISMTLIRNSGISIRISCVEIIAALMTRKRNTLVNPVSLCRTVGPGT